MTTAPRRSSGWRAARVVLILFGQLAVALVLLEVVARAVDLIGISYYPETAAYVRTLVQEEPIGYRNAFHLNGEFWGAPVTINSLGMRDREVEIEKTSGEFRIMMLGDSFVFGVGARQDETVARLLEARLNAFSDGEPRFRTLNMGAISYNTEQELIQLEALGPRLEPDLVTLFFSVNDIEPKMWVFDKRRSLVVRLVERSYALCLLAVAYREARFMVGGTDDRVALGAYEASSPRWVAVETSLARIARWCREREVPFILFTRFETEPSALRTLFDSTTSRLGIAVENVVPRSDHRWADLGPRDLANSRVDGHPNRTGSEAYAILVQEALEKAGVLP